jgi:hypothetical protein
MNTPIKITFYDGNDEIVKEFSRATIPWGILKRAVSLSRSVGRDTQEVSGTQLDEIAQLVVDLFGGQFTVDELNKGVDIGDMMAILDGIVTRAGELVRANPTTPPSSKRKR